MAPTKVALLGATGETGTSILEGLAHDGSFDITLLVRPSSAQKPAVQALASRGFTLLQIDTEKVIEPELLKPFETVISAIGPEGQLSQLNLATAAKAAGVKRFVPCGFITICPPGGVMTNRDQKEEVYNLIFKLQQPYTIIDTGFWHQLTFPKLPSGKVDHAHLYGINYLTGDGNAPNLLTDLRDIGPWVARIIKDPRTLNKKVVTWADELSQTEIYTLAERISGEKIERTTVSAKEQADLVVAAKAAQAANPTNNTLRMRVSSAEYAYSKYIRADNTRKNALYLGYLDARELFPDFKPITFEAFFKELLGGSIERPYKSKWAKTDQPQSNAPQVAQL